MYRVMVKLKGESALVGNGLTFASVALADAYGRDLYSRWTAVVRWEVVLA